jgi:hypothetical protein
MREEIRVMRIDVVMIVLLSLPEAAVGEVSLPPVVLGLGARPDSVIWTGIPLT